MRAEDIKIAIRKLIREEVKKIVAEEVNKAMGKVLVEMVREIKETPKHIVTESADSIEEPIRDTQAAVIKTKNPKLNNVLAETARNFTPLKKSGTSMVDLMDGGFETIGQNENMSFEEPKTNMDFLKQIVSQPSIPTTPSVLDNTAAVPDALQKVFKKDFRQVMKKIDEQKKNGGSGLINPSMLLG